MNTKYHAAPLPRIEKSSGPAVTDQFEQTWDRYVRALETMRRERAKLRETQRVLSELCPDRGKPPA